MATKAFGEHTQSQSLVTTDTSLSSGIRDNHRRGAVADFFDPEWMFGVSGGFNVVIGNPPYVLLQNAYLDDSVLNALKNIYRSAQYKVDTYHLFIERGIQLLAVDGVLSYITPNTFLKNKFTSRLRELIVQTTLIRDIVLFYIPVFNEQSVDNLILVCSKKRANNLFEQHHLRVHEIRGESFDTYVRNVRLYPQIHIKPPEYKFELDLTGSVAQIVAKLEETSKPFGEIGRTYFGIQTFGRHAFVSHKRLNPYFRPVIDGANVRRYVLLPSSEYVDFRPENIKSGGDSSVYENQRIVVRQIGKYPEGCLCPKNMLTLNTIYNLWLTTNVFDIRYILALINSSLIRFYWLSKYYDNKETFPKIKKRPLEMLPIRKAGSQMQEIIVNLVDRMSAHQLANPEAKTTALEAEIDQLVYVLYGLTPEEIAIVERAS